MGRTFKIGNHTVRSKEKSWLIKVATVPLSQGCFSWMRIKKNQQKIETKNFISEVNEYLFHAHKYFPPVKLK